LSTRAADHGPTRNGGGITHCNIRLAVGVWTRRAEFEAAVR
jgi:hypothetical protein